MGDGRLFGSRVRAGFLAMAVLHPVVGLNAQAKPPGSGTTQKALPPTTALLIDTDDSCRLTVDDQDEGVITPDKSKKLNVGLGDHIVKCVVKSVPDLMWRKVVSTKSSEQAAAIIALKALHIQYDQAVAQAQQKQQASTEEKRKTDENDQSTLYGQALLLYRKAKYSQAASLYQKACDQSEARACRKLAEMSIDHVLPDQNLIMSLSQRACDLGDARGCAETIYWYTTTEFIPSRETMEQGNQIYRRACDEGMGSACQAIAMRYETGKGVALDANLATQMWQRAAQFWERDCSGSELEGCFLLARRYQYGWGVPKDANLAAQAYQRAIQISKRDCDVGDLIACNDLGTVYLRGYGASKDPNLASQLFKRSCEGGFRPACGPNH